MIPLAFGGERDGAPQNIRREMDVRVGEHQPIAVRFFKPRHQRVRLPQPARRQRGNIGDNQIYNSSARDSCRMAGVWSVERSLTAMTSNRG